MNVTIRQPAGIGDIFYCQKIGVKLLELGFNVFWPVIPEYNYVGDYIDNGILWRESPYDSFELNLNKSTSYFYPKGSADVITNLMPSKYRLANKYYDVGDNSDWLSYFNFKRNHAKEEELFNLLELKEDEDYSLINPWVASPPLSQKMKIPSCKYKVVEMQTIPGFSLFDWCKVLENATEICTTDSALALIVEKLKTKKPNKYTIILRRPDKSVVSGMYSLDWNYITGV